MCCRLLGMSVVNQDTANGRIQGRTPALEGHRMSHKGSDGNDRETDDQVVAAIGEPGNGGGHYQITLGEFDSGCVEANAPKFCLAVVRMSGRCRRRR